MISREKSESNGITINGTGNIIRTVHFGGRYTISFYSDIDVKIGGDDESGGESEDRKGREMHSRMSDWTFGGFD